MNTAVAQPIPVRLLARAASSRRSLRVQAAKQSIEVNTGLGKTASFRAKTSAGNAPKLLSRVEQLRLLSKLEDAGLLALADKAGLSLSKIEDLGLLSKAEQLGALSIITDRNTPTLLTGAGVGLLLIGPAAVFFLPDGDITSIVLQSVIALVGALGAAAAIAGGSVVSKLQN